MKKNITEEINRIHNLMGIKTQISESILLEQGSWLRFLAIKGSDALTSFFDNLKSLKVKGKLTSEEVDNLMKELEEKLGASSDEISDLKKIIDEYRLASLSDEESDFIKWVENAYAASDEIPGIETLEKMAILSPKQIEEIFEYFKTKLAKNLGIGGKEYVAVINYIKAYLDGFPITLKNNPNKIYSSREDMFREMDERLHAQLKDDVKQGKSLEPEAKELYDRLKQFYRNDADLNAYMDEGEKNGIIGFETKKPEIKWEDTPKAIENKINNEILVDKSPIEFQKPDVELDFIPFERNVDGDILDDELKKIKDDIDSKVKENGEESLTATEKEIKNSVEEWKQGKPIDDVKLKERYNNQPSPSQRKMAEDIRAKGVDITQSEKEFLDAVDDFDATGVKKDWETLELNVFKQFEDEFGSLGSTFINLGTRWTTRTKKPFAKFYNNTLRPAHLWWISMWQTRLNLFLVNIGKRESTQFFKTIEESLTDSMERAFSRYQYSKIPNKGDLLTKGKAGVVSITDLRKIQKDLLRLLSDSTPKTASGYRYSRKLVWELYKKNVYEQLLKTDPAGAEDFKIFCGIIDSADESTYHLSTEQILNDGLDTIVTKTDNSNVLGKTSQTEGKIGVGMLDDASKVADDVLQNSVINNSKILGKTVKNWIKSSKLFQQISSKYLGGIFKSPKDVQDYLVKNGYGARASAIQAGKAYAFTKSIILGVGLVLTGIYWYFNDPEVYNAVRDQYGSTGEFVLKEIILKEVCDVLFGDDDLTKMISEAMGKDWTMFGADIISGWFDNDVLWVITALIAWWNKQEQYTGDVTMTEKANNKAVEEVDKGLEEKIEEMGSEAFDTSSGYAGIMRIVRNKYPHLSSYIKQIPKIPKDYFQRLKTAGEDVNLQKTVSSLETLMSKAEDLLTGDDKSNINNMIESLSIQPSVVISDKKNVEYLLLYNTSKDKTITKDERNKAFKSEDVVWVSPEFKLLNIGIEREFKSLKDFKL